MYGVHGVSVSMASTAYCVAHDTLLSHTYTLLSHTQTHSSHTHAHSSHTGRIHELARHAVGTFGLQDLLVAGSELRRAAEHAQETNV